jgi:hypothetical protein
MLELRSKVNIILNILFVAAVIIGLAFFEISKRPAKGTPTVQVQPNGALIYQGQTYLIQTYNK